MHGPPPEASDAPRRCATPAQAKPSGRYSSRGGERRHQ
ncbi:hypothetical protein FM106_09935 [Brachybacterium faecium]|nr:hypothetical protein FM106_09935 [Brachybacterium faecium]